MNHYINAIADPVRGVAISKLTITPIAYPAQTQLGIHPDLADKSPPQSIDAHLKIAILLVRSTTLT